MPATDEGTKARPIDEDYVLAFTTGYLECALWCGVYAEDENGELVSSDDEWAFDDVQPSAREEIESDCLAFVTDNYADLQAILPSVDASAAGHDFYLTRNRHGAGYWDGDVPEPMATRLTDAAHVYGTVDLYVGDDGKVYGS